MTRPVGAPLHRPARPLRILAWPVHGNYAQYLAHCGHELLFPVADDGSGGPGPNFDWPDSVRGIPWREVATTPVDAVLFQSARNWERDQHEVLSEAQRRGPRIYVEHDPPRSHPTDTRHPVDDPDVLLVHVTHFNRLMWDSGRTPTVVVEHGVPEPRDAAYGGTLERGVAVVNGLPSRGRRLGRDLFEELRRRVPIDLIGLESEELGGLGPITARDLPAAIAPYRFFFHPARYTSLGLAVLEAMALGMPVVGLATTELPSLLEDGRNGFISNDLDALERTMRRLLDDPELARRVGAAGRETVRERHGLSRFAADWADLFTSVTELGARRAAARWRERHSPARPRAPR